MRRHSWSGGTGSGDRAEATQRLGAEVVRDHRVEAFSAVLRNLELGFQIFLCSQENGNFARILRGRIRAYLCQENPGESA